MRHGQQRRPQTQATVLRRCNPVSVETVYILWHTRPGFDENGDETDIKLLGVFSTEDGAKAWARDANVLPGFRNFSPDCFLIDAHQRDQRRWTEGFDTVTLPE